MKDEPASSVKDEPAPDIFTYLDYRVFLADWFKWMKVRYPRFSHRGFARRANQTAPSLPSKVISGERNLTPTTMQAFIKGLNLEPDAALFFEDLVALDQAETPKLRTAAREQVRATLRFREARVIEGHSVQYLMRWYIPAIREYATCSGFRADPHWLASHMRPTITTAEAAEALEVLFALGFLERRADGTVAQAGGALVTPHEFANIAAAHYHIGMLDQATAALWNTHKSDRHFLGVTAAIPADLIPILKRDLDRLQERLLERYDGAPGERKIVCQVNLNFFPLTERPECDEP